jgi:hypothetical protein
MEPRRNQGHSIRLPAHHDFSDLILWWRPSTRPDPQRAQIISFFSFFSAGKGVVVGWAKEAGSTSRSRQHPMNLSQCHKP